MSADITIASPLYAEAPDAAAKAESADLTLTERRDVGLLLVRGRLENPEFVAWFEQRFGVAPPEGRVSILAGGFSIVRMARTDYLISGEIGAMDALSRQAEAAAEDAPCIACDITHGRLIVDMGGPSTLTVLSKSCGLDMREGVFPIGLGTRTRFADMLVYVERKEFHDFRLISDTSTGVFLWRWLKEASGV